MKLGLLALVGVIAGIFIISVVVGSLSSSDSTAPTSTATTAPSATNAPSKPALTFGEGVYKVGVDIEPGLYKAAVTSGNGYWARLRSPDTTDIIANDLKTDGTMYLRVLSSDKYIEISGVTFTKVS
jgi:hypothetical protein